MPCPRAAGGQLRRTICQQAMLPRHCRSLGADLLHALQFIVPLRAPCPVVANVYDLAWRAVPRSVERSRRAYYRLMVPRSLHAAAALLAASEATAEDIRRWYPAEAHKVTVVPPGTPSWVWEDDEGGASLPPPARPYFLFVGTREPRKNLAGLVRAYAGFVDAARARSVAEAEIPDLVLAGQTGWLPERALRRHATELGDRLRMPGYVPRADLRRLYRDALALVFPSLHEGFGLPILEAMALGVPVLTSGPGRMAEVAGGHALLVDPDDPGESARACMSWHGTASELPGRWADAGPGPRPPMVLEKAADADGCEVYRRLLGPDRRQKGLPPPGHSVTCPWLQKIGL